MKPQYELKPGSVAAQVSPQTKIVALSCKQPFGTMMLHGKIETRTWNTSYRGLVLICASKRSYNVEAAMNIFGQKNLMRVLKFVQQDPDFDKLNGFAIAIGELVDCRPMVKKDEAKTFVEYHEDLFCHVYKNVHRINPFPFTGSQRWKQLSITERKSIIIL